MNDFELRTLEPAPPGTRVATPELLDALKWTDEGLVGVITQDHASGEVLMFAWMNLEALQETLATGQVCYYSRSRAALWRKGETSGQRQTLRELRTDCDGDVLLARVDQQGVACHTGRHNCFYISIGPDEAEVRDPVEVDPATLYGSR